ncbi:hypothetical protein [Amycolatopsis sulphurea]|uniref:hypothetical protein n=1 Tax=Amycolatopsis sulphurea TaxID=76022 RepID=UPI001FE457D7|nr:hypothetical protein [Amycolatopsis sulphurea]
MATEPGSTTATIAMAGRVGRSTAAKILASWDRDGIAIRTPGNGPRNPDTWALAPSDRDTAAPDADETHADATAAPGTDPTAADHFSDTDKAPEEPVATADDTNDTDNVPAKEEVIVEGPGTSSETDNDSAPDISDDVPAATVDTDGTTPPPDDTAPVDTATEAKPSPSASRTIPEATDVATPKDKDRLPKGGLRALVEEYLTKHPGEDFGPAKIGKVLGRSGGAVNNALEKLVTDGSAVKTCEAPKRFAINPAKTDVPETAGDAE